MLVAGDGADVQGMEEGAMTRVQRRKLQDVSLWHARLLSRVMVLQAEDNRRMWKRLMASAGSGPHEQGYAGAGKLREPNRARAANWLKR